MSGILSVERIAFDMARSKSTLHHFKGLNLTELETRAVPAIYAVTLLSPDAGDPGSTDATHTGKLRIDPTLPTFRGTKTVGAASPAAAVEAALTGTVTATLSGQSVSYPFGRDAAGTSAADRLPYLVDVSGDTALVWLEDMAGFAGVSPDWDYNDRSWRVDVRRLQDDVSPPATPPPPPDGGTISTLTDPIDSGTFVWSNTFGETATVAYTVEWYDPETYLWRYAVTNDNLSVSSLRNLGIGGVEIELCGDITVFDTAIESGVTDWYADPTYPFWHRHDVDGSYLVPGNTAVFTFKTPPMPIVYTTGTAEVFARTPTLAHGPIKAPGCDCDHTDPTLTTKTGWDRWEQTPMGQVRGEKNAATPDWTEPVAGTWRTPGPPAAGQDNIGEEGGYYRTKDQWGQFTMTVEFRFAPEPTRVRAGTPTVKPMTNQDFGNSGVYIHDRYEVQIIDPSRFDSPNDPAGGVPYEGEVKNDPRDADVGNRNKQVPGSLYGVDSPNPKAVPNGKFNNQSKPAPTWNTLVIEYCPPVLEADPANPGKMRIKTAAKLKTILNGKLVWGTVDADGNEVAAEIKDATGPLKGTGGRKNAEPVDRGPIYLQSHWGNQVEFRSPVVKGRLMT